eukprot:gene2978-12987_t
MLLAPPPEKKEHTIGPQPAIAPNPAPGPRPGTPPAPYRIDSAASLASWKFESQVVAASTLFVKRFETSRSEMPSRGLVLSLVLLATICHTITPRALHSVIPHVSKCNLCEICEIKPGQAHRRLRKMLSFEGDGHQERPADPADRLEQLTDERQDKMFSEMKARGDGDALELDLHEFEWDSVAAGIQTASVGPHVWIDPVGAIVPEYGVHIWWNGLWMEKADGISMSQLSRSTNHAFVSNTTMDLLQVKLNKTRVVEVALMDLLTSQCDKHSQNVFINEHGNIKAMHFSWTQCGADSLFLPGTGKNEVVRFGNGQVHKEAKANINAFKERLSPMVLLDYRCYVDGGKIGNNYPPRLTKCLTKLANMSAEEVTQEYKFPMLRNGQALVSRAKDMLHKGFEWTLKFGTPSNLAPRRYLWHQPCCSIVHKHGATRCGHKWNASAVFPIGDPYTGREWNRKYPDSGQFVGGTRFEW